MGRGHPWGRWALLACAATAAVPAPASAAGYVSLDERVAYWGDDAANRVTLTETADAGNRWLVVRDASGALEAGAGCASVSLHEARCRLRERWPLTQIELAGADDTLAVAFAAGVVSVDAGAGDDVVDVTALADVTAEGGDGDDVLRGGLTGTTARRTDDESETVLDGGNGHDRLYAGDIGNHLTGGAGRDRLRGGRGPDALFVDADDVAVNGRAGNDSITRSPWPRRR